MHRVIELRWVVFREAPVCTRGWWVSLPAFRFCEGSQVSSETSNKEPNHPSASHEPHHSKGATFVDPLGESAIEESVSHHPERADEQSVAMLDGAREINDQEGDAFTSTDRSLATVSAGPLDPVLSVEELGNTKVTPDNADQWLEEIKIRMDKLRQDVDELNARLDRFKRP
jgi:hypothetical protein